MSLLSYFSIASFILFLLFAFFNILLYFFHICRPEKEPPSTLMWTLFFLAQVEYHQIACCYCYVPLMLSNNLFSFSLLQHYDRRGQYDVALSKIDEAIGHTPTVIDLYSVKVDLHLPSVNFYVQGSIDQSHFATSKF